MRSFSNIMPNFADKLHLLVDSIRDSFFKFVDRFSFTLSCFRNIICNFAAQRTTINNSIPCITIIF